MNAEQALYGAFIVKRFNSSSDILAISWPDESIKSLEDFDVTWVEEAQTLSARSLRSEGWNPRRKKDAIDEFASEEARKRYRP